jgi:PDZ domain-containing protein
MTDVQELARPWPTPPPATRRRRRRGRLVVWIVVAVVVLIGVTGMLVRLPYVLISPGRATAVDGAVTIDGAPTFEHDGEVLYLTVQVSTSRPNLFRMLSAWLDDDTEIVDEQDVLGGRTRAEDARLNRLEMANSQMVAKTVALERLGYTVTATGTGVAVVAITPGSPADGTLRTGDVITAVDGQAITLSDELGPAIRSHAPGEPVTLTVERGDDERAVEVGTRAAPDGPCEGKAQLGIVGRTRDEKFDYPVDVTIDTGRVGGPSAGLAFTLTIIDELTPGDLTGGRPVAVTGTIEPDGRVGPIGGVAQKAVAAKDAGARLFIVPGDELRDAREHAGGMKVVGVATLDEALRALRRDGGEVDVPPAAPAPAC